MVERQQKWAGMATYAQESEGTAPVGSWSRETRGFQTTTKHEVLDGKSVQKQMGWLVRHCAILQGQIVGTPCPAVPNSFHQLWFEQQNCLFLFEKALEHVNSSNFELDE